MGDNETRGDIPGFQLEDYVAVVVQAEVGEVFAGYYALGGVQ